RATKTDDAQSRAQVEDRTLSQGAGESGGGAQTSGLDARGDLSPAALNDPDSPLAVRIIYFDYDSANIRADFADTVAAHAAFLAANPTISVTLEGHADERGSREYNLALGERRALAVRRQLVLLGAAAGQVRTVSYGEERPTTDGHDESSYALNRRVEMVY
ncbi:MAG: peptidoglycan-associated lipoprotein Pal, partial [Xanthomonadales bacterium]|nr:peptidoglycan-associated lipoprotein Pal [Xanthomonadales bacterium]